MPLCLIIIHNPMLHGQDWGDWGELNPPPSVSQTDVQKPLHHKHHRNDSDCSSPFHNDMISLDILAVFLPWGISPVPSSISHPKGIWTPDLLFDRQALWTRLSYEALCFTVHQVSLECQHVKFYWSLHETQSTRRDLNPHHLIGSQMC